MKVHTIRSISQLASKLSMMEMNMEMKLAMKQTEKLAIQAILVAKKQKLMKTALETMKKISKKKL